MDRRAFLRGSAVAVAGIPAVAAPSPTAVRNADGRRVSCVQGDPGYRLYCMARGDRQTVKVFLDGVEQKWAETADEVEGFIDRAVATPNGNLAHDGHEILKERVYGDVRIVIA